MSIDLMEKRLQDLEVETPDAGRVTARVLSRGARPRASRLPRLAAVGLATVALAVLIAYFVPAADAALAGVPFAGDLLRDAGLVGAAGRITSVGAVSTSSGYRVQLVGAYADSTRTVLLLHAEPPIAAATRVELTDQFGRSFEFHGSTSNMLSGDLDMQFEPLAWPDAITGARITLRVTQIEPPGRNGRPVAGTWTLPATLGVDVAKPLPLPAPATTGPAHYRFASVSYTPATIAIDIEITGMPAADIFRRIPDGRKGTPVFTVDLLDPSGAVINGNGGYGPPSNQQGLHLLVFGYRQGPGDYTLRVTYIGAGQFERVIHVP